MFLSVEQYNKNEKEGKAELSNRFLEAFQPEVFEKLGFPTRVNSNKEVFRYIDSMHDGRLKYYYNNFDMKPTEEEFQSIKNMSKEIFDYTSERYKRGIIVKAPLLSSAIIVRKIKALTDYDNVPTIFEIGGGTGILGAMLHKEGYTYISTDITQAFYLTQNNLWEGLFPRKVEECFELPLELKSNDKMYHIPYWKLWELTKSELEADIIVANHCLAEMHQRALEFYLAYGKKLMRNSKYKLLVAQAPGDVAFGEMSILMKTFEKMGYVLLYSDTNFIVFSLNNKENCKPIDYKEWLYQLKYKTTDFKGMFFNYNNLKDDTAKLVQSNEEKVKNEKKVSLTEINNYFESLSENIDSPDEEFIHFLGYEYI